MRTLKTSVFLFIAFSLAAVSACKKCHDCHYEDSSGKEVALGEKCDKELENLEKNGIVVNGVKHDVHCHGH